MGDLLKILKPGDYLLIEDNDRLSREDPLAAMNLLHGIVFKGVTVITLRDGDIITKDNFFNLSTFLPSIVKSALANEENVKKSMRIKESWQTRRKTMATGKFIGGRHPFWLQRNPDKTLSIIEERASVIRGIFDMAYKGMGFRSIMHALAKDTVPTFRRNKRWSKGGVSYLLKNIAVYGAIQPYSLENKKRKPVGDPIEGYYPAIVKKGKYLAVQEKISKRLMFGGGSCGTKVSNLFSGICKCSKCGENMILSNKGRHDTSYLACSSYHWHHTCTKAIINYIQVEKCLLDYIIKEPSAIQHFSHDDSSQQAQQKIEEKKALLHDVEQRVARLTDRLEGPDAPEPLMLRLRERMAEQEKIKQEIDRLTGEQYAKANTVSISSIVSNWTKYLTRAGITVTISPLVQAKIIAEQSKAFENRLALKEAFRNSVKQMQLDVENKRLSITWNSNITSVIEMTCKRMGRAKAVYLYRTSTNSSPLSEWVNIGAIMAVK